MIDRQRKLTPEYDEQDKKEQVTSREWTSRRALGKSAILFELMLLLADVSIRQASRWELGMSSD